MTIMLQVGQSDIEVDVIKYIKMVKSSQKN